MKTSTWKRPLAFLTGAAICVQLMAFGTVGSIAVTDDDLPAAAVTQTETAAQAAEYMETTTTPPVHADYAGVLEYDDSPMQVGETRAIRFYDPTTGTGSKAYFEAVSDNISYTYETGSDTFYVTALEEGEASMHVLVSGCTFYSVLHLTVASGTTAPTEEHEETTTTTTMEIQVDYVTKVEYDTSPMQVGETRAIRFYHPETLKGGKGSIYEVSDNLSYAYEEGSDTIYVTALAEGDAKMYVMAEGCAFGSYVRLTVEAGTTAPTEDYEEMMTTTTEPVHADYAGVLEYDDSPMQVGETRAVRFYDPTTGTGSKAYFEAVSDNISYTYETGSDTFYVTALAEGEASMYVLVSGCTFHTVLKLTIEAGTAAPTLGELNGDNAVNANDAALLLTAAAQAGAGEQPDVVQNEAADLNGDGTGDAADAALILQYAAYAGTGGTDTVADFLLNLQS